MYLRTAQESETLTQFYYSMVQAQLPWTELLRVYLSRTLTQAYLSTAQDSGYLPTVESHIPVTSIVLYS
jgi:hypothetical protein